MYDFLFHFSSQPIQTGKQQSLTFVSIGSDMHVQDRNIKNEDPIKSLHHTNLCLFTRI